jgi:hypothetical protein
VCSLQEDPAMVLSYMPRDCMHGSMLCNSSIPCQLLIFMILFALFLMACSDEYEEGREKGGGAA